MPTNSPVCRPSLSDASSSDGKPQRANRFRALVGAGGDAEDMNTARDFVVVDVETSGFDPIVARVLSVAALTLTADGSLEHSMCTLLNPGVDPGPTNIHGLTPAMLAGQPCYADIAEHLAPLLRGRVLVAHNAAFDYSFLAAEARRCDAELPVTSVLCTLELAALLDLGLGSLSLAALAHLTSPRPARTTPSMTPESSPLSSSTLWLAPPNSRSPCRSGRPPPCRPWKFTTPPSELTLA
jgi:DNA polymerase-3 subunit epsilon